MPERSYVNSALVRILNLVLLILSFALIAAGALLIFQNASLYDEGISAVAAKRIAGGEMPYKDYWLIYTPLQFFLYSFFLKISDQLIMLRVVDFVIKLLTVYIAIKLIKQDRKRISLLEERMATVCLLLVIFSSGIAMYPIFLSVLLCLLAYVVFRRGRIIFGCALSVLAILSKFEVGLFFSVAFGISLLQEAIMTKQFRTLIKYAVVILILLAAVILLMGAFMGFGQIYECLIYFPKNIYPATRKIPFPAFDKFSSYAYLVIVSAGMLILYWLYSFFKKKGPGSFFLTCFTLFYLGMAYKLFIRPSFANAVMIIFLLVIIGFCIIKDRKSLNAAFLMPILLLLLFSGYKLFFFLGHTVEKVKVYGFSEKCLNDPDENDIIDFIKAHQDSSFYFGVINHDRVAYNPVMFYFFEKKVPTYYQELHPGQVTTTSVQQHIVEELEKGKVQYVLLLNTEFNEPNKSSTDTHIEILDQYIRGHYTTVRQFGMNYTLMQLK